MYLLLKRLQKTYRLISNIAIEIFSSVHVVKMSVYFNRDGSIIKNNWGDDINYWFLKEISQKKIIPYDWSLLTQWLHRPYIAGIGSILTLFNMDNAIVWGSGIISSTDKVQGSPKEILAVRGPLTRARLLEQGINCPEVYGDPALLLPKYYNPKCQKKYKLGVIAHYTDQNNPLLHNLKNDRDVLMIDIKHYNHWLSFIDEICMCEAIASSSLHGLIMSVAYGIPNVWLKLEGSVLGDDFKFHDFFLSLHKDRDAIIIRESVSSSFLLSHCRLMSMDYLDLDQLFEVCPFNLRDNYEIKA